MKYLIIIPIIIILSLLIYPSISNFLAYSNPPQNEDNRRLRGIAIEFDFERFVNYLKDNNLNKFNYEIFSDYIKKNSIELSEENFRYLFDLISGFIESGSLSGLGEKVSVQESVSFVIERNYFFGMMKLPVQTNFATLRTLHRIFFYSIYFLMFLFIFLCFKGIIFRGKKTESYLNSEDLYPY